MNSRQRRKREAEKHNTARAARLEAKLKPPTKQAISGNRNTGKRLAILSALAMLDLEQRHILAIGEPDKYSNK